MVQGVLRGVDGTRSVVRGGWYKECREGWMVQGVS